MQANSDIKDLMKEEGVRQWQVADVLNMNEATLSRILRRNLDTDMESRIIQAINSIALENQQENIRSACSRFAVENQFQKSNCKGDNTVYPELLAEMARKNITITQIARDPRINRTISTMSMKLSGKADLLFREAIAIKEIIDSKLPIEVLFREKESA